MAAIIRKTTHRNSPNMNLYPALLAVAFGGAFGALARYGVTLTLVHFVYKETFWAPLTINLIGCFAIGVVSALILHHKPHAAWALILMTGFLGSFTTYSTFTLDALTLMQKGQFSVAFLHLSIQLLGGFALCLAGLATAQQIINWQQ